MSNIATGGIFSFRHSRHKCVCDGIKNLVNYFNRINKDKIKVQFLLFSFWLARSILTEEFNMFLVERTFVQSAIKGTENWDVIR